jgi:hypothetical protein
MPSMPSAMALRARREQGSFTPARSIPDKSMLFFGADPCHTPATEDSSPVGCRSCGGLTVDGDGFPVVATVARGEVDPLPNTETVVFICKCGRSHYRHLPGRKTEGNDDIARQYGRDLTAADPEKVSRHKFRPKGAGGKPKHAEAGPVPR